MSFNNKEILKYCSLFLLISLPFSLIFSILIAGIITGFLGLIGLYWIIYNNNFREKIKYTFKPLLILVSFYILILVSLFFSDNFLKSFPPSFFYFRYFLLSLAIFYIVSEYKYSLKLILNSILILITIILFDSLIDLYQYKNDEYFFLTSYFGDEKKLGSFLVRLLPFTIAIIIYLDEKIYKKIYIEIIIISIVGFLIYFANERMAFFYFFCFLIFYLKILKNKFFIIVPLIFIILLSLTQKKYFNKYFYATLNQFGIVNTFSLREDTKFTLSNIHYISLEHEKLIKSGFEIFKENFITGSGLKTYHKVCQEIRVRKSLDIECSTHPHNTYIQIISDIGIFGGLIIFSIFIYILRINFKIIKKKEISKNLKCYYILNIGIIINLMPLVPSGSFFNNWINLMIYFPFGLWLYMYHLIKVKNG